MPIARVMHIFQSNTGLPRDNVVSTFYFQVGPPIDPPVIDTLVNIVGQFFNFEGTGQTDRVGSFIAEASLLPNRERYKVYDMSGPPPHPPLADVVTTPTIPNNSEQPLPPEVALCLSYSGSSVPGLTPARRRGRLYIGPLNATTLASAGGTSRPVVAAQTALVEAGTRLRQNAIAENMAWVVRSPTNNDTTPILNLWCDDAWDIQRRRGNSPSMRISDV